MFIVKWDREFLEGNLKGIIYCGSKVSFPNLWDAESFLNDMKALNPKEVRYFNFRIELEEAKEEAA